MTNDKQHPQEKEAVRTTIVGGRPPGPGKSIGQIPRGIEVLVKKASVDPAFKNLLIEKRAEAANEIDLQLDADEALLLAAIPGEQLEVFIRQMRVPDSKKSVFLGKVAAAMLIALGAAAGCDRDIATTGIRDDDPEEKAAAASRPAESETQPALPPGGPQGIRPDVPTTTRPTSQPVPPPNWIRGFSRGIRPEHPKPKPPPTEDEGPASQPDSQPASQPDDSADDS